MTRCSEHQAVAGSSPPTPHVMLSSEQTSLSCFLFPLSLIYFLQSLFRSCCQTIFLHCCSDDIIPSLNSPLSLVSWSKLAFISLDSLCASLTSFPLFSPASFHQLRHWIVISDVLLLRNLFIFASNKESIPIPLSQTFSGFFQTDFVYVCILKNMLSTSCMHGIVLCVLEVVSRK